MRNLTTLALCMALAGCAYIPPYQRPEPPVADRWAQAEGPRQVTDVSWRQAFPDPRLQALIEAALDNNRDMRIAVARVAEARAIYGIQKADTLPGLNLGASHAAARVPADLSTTGSSSINRRNDLNVALPAFELDFWGRVASLNEAAKAAYLASEDAQRAFRLSLIINVVDAYLALQDAAERLALARTTLATRAETRTLIDKRREAGLAGELDYLAADGAYQTAQADAANLARQQAQAENFLDVLVGIQKADWPAGRTLAEQGIVNDLAAGIPSDVLARRPDVVAAEERLKAANANIGAARAAFFPRISLTAALGFASRDLANLFDGGAWAYQPVLTFPLFDGGRNQASLDLAGVRKNIAVAEYEKTIQQTFREVADGLAARAALSAQLSALMQLEATQQQRFTLADARYRQGLSSYLEVLDAQRDLFAAQQATIQTRRALLSANAHLYAALGGGGLQ
jgi:multidrug efflux system outer membrane protein